MRPPGTTVAPPPGAGNGGTPTKKTEAAVNGFRLPESSSGRGKAIILNAVEGFGKTSAVAFAEDSALICAPHETGYLTLVEAGIAPARPYVIANTWSELLNIVKGITPDVKLLALDAIGGFERLNHENIVKRDFRGEWGEKGFASYQKGYTQSIPDWMQLIAALDNVRAAGTDVVILGHTKIKTFKNPIGTDYDRYVCDVHESTWGVTHKWADAVLFGNFYQVIEEEKRGRHKGKGGTERVLYTEHRDTWDAKNRFGMPESIDIPNDPSLVWETICNSMRKAGK